MEPDKLFKLVSPSVWLVRTFDRDGLPLSSGSAVVIHAHQLITNCHVLGEAASFSLVKEKISFKGELQQVDLERDLCLITVSDKRFTALRRNALADSDQLSVGQRAVALGNPRALEMTLSDGLISRLQKNDEEQLEAIQTSAPFSPGSSGGGLFDMDGRLVGITQRIDVLAGSQNLNFALPDQLADESGRPQQGAALGSITPAGKAGPQQPSNADVFALAIAATCPRGHILQTLRDRCIMPRRQNRHTIIKGAIWMKAWITA